MAALGEDLLGIVNKLQDLVFNTIGNDSLDLPQIVTTPPRHARINRPANSASRSSSAHSPLASPLYLRTSLAGTFFLVEVASSRAGP